MESVIADDGVRLWASRSGAADPLVLCHGGPGLWDMFEDMTALPAPLSDAVRWDQRGCGRSQRCDGPWSTERFVADLEAVRRHFGLAQMTLLGHSWGAQLALSYALAHPGRVRALLYVSGTGIGPDADWHPAYKANLLARLGESPERLARWREAPNGSRERALIQWSAEFEDRRRALEHAERMADPWFGVNVECNAALNAERLRDWGTAELYTACTRLETPVLIVDGARDIRPRSAVDSLERALPHVRRVTLAGAGHLPWAEDPEGFRNAVASIV
ncbi:alpha/beta fold hydrolase [Streptomyces sp. NPDC054884]|uniref:alpha/beta fold hydrolase n=1 Tax=Streptomyces sp. ME08-AFT2 TaxID=3028683 RepID=UPI0029BD92D9|nr:alpha/beta hydrolase [Streptomyces sp. ME08-AFT2]MDX3313753.1 alpha/beta hydrolase [Streptomyces sp. ME08-AFT2]